MLPERLSNNLTSLNLNEDRIAVIVEMEIDVDGTVQNSDVYQAQVRNHAKLAYNSVAAWLEGSGPVPTEITAVNGLEENLRLQDRVTQCLKNLHHLHGALTLKTIKSIQYRTQISSTRLKETGMGKSSFKKWSNKARPRRKTLQSQRSGR
jgi:exoribonuclease R